MPVEIVRERPDTPDASALVLELEVHLAARYPDESRHGFSVRRLVDEDVHFFVLRADGAPAGCGGILFVGDEYGEVKRMYVRPAYRGAGHGRRILERLVGHARERGITLLRLETGVDQVEAIGLYELIGFRRCAPFGPYRDDPLSPCFEVRLDEPGPGPRPSRGRTEVTQGEVQVTSGHLCEDALRALDRLCAVERRAAGPGAGLTPRQRSRRSLLEKRARAGEWTVPAPLAATVRALIAAADRIEDPAVAAAWTDHLPVAVLACLERRGLARRVAEDDPFLASA